MNISYENAIEKLKSEEMFHIKPGLERISAILEKLGNPQDKLKYIHVAGTNGKGSVCAIIESILREAGIKTGLYTSPHIFDYTERIKISGENISKSDFVRLFEKAYNVSKKSDISITEFEILTVIMFLYFAENKVEVAILETGMGGRFDATNVIKENLCSVITQIDLDHTDRLGKTKNKIAFEKAGIIKPNCPVVTAMGYEEIKNRADEMNSMLIFVSDYVDKKFVDALSLRGRHQAENLALALGAIDYVFPEISNDTILKGLKKVRHPFRFEYFKNKNLIVDVAHNPNGIRALRNNLDLYFPDEKRRFVFGCLKTKDYKQMMDILFRESDEVYINEFDYPNACTYDELSAICPVNTKKYDENLEFSPDKLNIICGSFYMLSSLKYKFDISLK